LVVFIRICVLHTSLHHLIAPLDIIYTHFSSLYYAPAGRYINAGMQSLKKSVKPEIVNRYDLWVLRHKIGGAKVCVNNVQWSDQRLPPAIKLIATI
jgi:hypothetical protein